MNLRSDAFRVGPLIAFIAGMAVVAMFWASAIEMPIREVLKTAVGPGLGALIGASLAFHLNTTEKRRDERTRNIKALREAQFAMHFRFGMLSEYFQKNLAPYEQDSERWKRVPSQTLAIEEMLPPVKSDHLTFLAFGKRPALLQDVHAAALHFQNACAAVNKRDRAFDALIHRPSGIAADQLAQAFQKELVEKLYKAMPGTILHLEHVYRLLVQELGERYPKETAYGPIAQTNPATSLPR